MPAIAYWLLLNYISVIGSISKYSSKLNFLHMLPSFLYGMLGPEQGGGLGSKEEVLSLWNKSLGTGLLSILIQALDTPSSTNPSAL